MLRPDYIIYRYNRYKNFIIGLYTVGTCLTYWFKHIYDKKGATHRSSRKQIPTGRCNYVACNVQPIQDYECGLSYLLVVPYASLFVRSSRSHRFNLQVVSATKVRHLSGEDSAMEATHRNKNNINTLCDPAVHTVLLSGRQFALCFGSIIPGLIPVEPGPGCSKRG